MAGNQVSCKSASTPANILTAPQLSTALTIQPSANKVVKIGDTFTIKAILSPDDVTNNKVDWTVSDSSKATLSANTSDSGIRITVTAKKTGTVTITATPADGQAQYTKSITVTINPLTIADISPKYYGDYMDYPIDLGLTTAEHTLVDGTIPKTNWRVFYKDDTYTYLIASSYIQTSKFPDGVFTDTSGNYIGYWPSAPAGTTPSWEYKDRFLFNGLNTVNSSNYNYRCASTLLNTDLWKNFVNNNYAKACIGSPTLEMLCSSWNEVTPKEPISFGVNTTGYTVNTTSLNSYSGYNNTLYIPHQTVIGGCYGIFTASPCGMRDDDDLVAWGYGGVGGKDTYRGPEVGICPVVMIKSTLLAEKHDVDGIWEIKGNSLTLDVTEDQEKFICNTFEVTPTVHSSIENKKVNWYSSNTNVATVSTATTQSGTAVLVKCVGEGEATITAALAGDSKQTESFKVTVSDTYVNYPVDLGIANNTAHTLVDGTVPKTDWRILYQDGTYTYLIASSYIHCVNFPPNVFTSNNGTYTGKWSNLPVGTNISWEYKDRFLFNGLRNVNSSNANYKCVSYLLNTTLWKKYVDSERDDIDTNFADACIGGPTLEMICASWSESTPNEPLFYEVNTNGYIIGSSTPVTGSSSINGSGFSGFNNTLFFPHNNVRNTNLWNDSWNHLLASPGGASANYMSSLRHTGIIGDNNDWTYGGTIRPVVCLKSTTKLTKDSNGIWQLSVS